MILSAPQAFAQMQSLDPEDTFSAAKLSPTETRAIFAAVEDSAFDTPTSWERELRVRHVDLGRAPGLIVQGTTLLCGGTGNCQTWVFRKFGGKWVSMFVSDPPPLAEGYQLGPATTGGIKDLTITLNTSAETEQRVTYQFDGSMYRAK